MRLYTEFYRKARFNLFLILTRLHASTLGRHFYRSYCRPVLPVKATPKSSQNNRLVAFVRRISAKIRLQLLVNINTVKRTYIALSYTADPRLPDRTRIEKISNNFRFSSNFNYCTYAPRQCSCRYLN